MYGHHSFITSYVVPSFFCWYCLVGLVSSSLVAFSLFRVLFVPFFFGMSRFILVFPPLGIEVRYDLLTHTPVRGMYTVRTIEDRSTSFQKWKTKTRHRQKKVHQKHRTTGDALYVAQTLWQESESSDGCLFCSVLYCSVLFSVFCCCYCYHAGRVVKNEDGEEVVEAVPSVTFPLLGFCWSSLC